MLLSIRARALRLAAQSLYASKTALGAFFRRVRARKGSPKAVTATARKLACLVYRILRYGMEYTDLGQQQYEQRYQEHQRLLLQKRAAALGYQLTPLQTGGSFLRIWHEAFGFTTIDENDLATVYTEVATISTEVVFPLVLLSPRRSLTWASFRNHELLPPMWRAREGDLTSLGCRVGRE